MAASPTPEDQGRLLEEALGMVRQQAAQMRRCLETPGKLMDALKCASTLVSELRTPTLGPKQYYELYMSVFDALRHLTDYLRDSHPVDHLADLYELVQYAGNIIPRLYLMITVGTVYMGVGDAPVKEIMKDMMEMSRGVQHPIRGLFLRYYLIGQARDNLPIKREDGPQGCLQDSINFILTNFVEMNKLWVRWQHQGHSRERDQRTQERRELELLVGSNLVRLSQLVDLETYKEVIVGPLLEQVVQCRDVLAQEYLLEVVTKVFPDEFHLHTLDQMLSAIARLNPHVDMKKIVIGLMDRLASYAQRENEGQESENLSDEEKAKVEEAATLALLEKLKLEKDNPPEPKPEKSKQANGPAADSEHTETPVDTAQHEEIPPVANGSNPANVSEVKLFEIFYGQVVALVKNRQLSIQDTMALLTSLANLALNIYPSQLEYVDQVLAYANEKTRENTDSADLHSAPTQSNMLSLLLSPVRTYHSLFTALALPNYLPLFTSQAYATRRSVASEVARTLLKSGTKITTVPHLEGVLTLLRVLIKEGLSQQPTGISRPAIRTSAENDEALEDQTNLAKLVHSISSPSTSTQLTLLQTTRRAYEAAPGDRIKYTTPAIITKSLKLARQLKSREHLDDTWQQQSSTLYRFIHQTLTQLYTRTSVQAVSNGPSLGVGAAASSASSAAELSLRLFTTAALVADATGHEEFAYEFLAQAFTIYEDSISDSRAQFQAVCIIAGALCQCRGFGRENYDTLITKAALHGSKLLKKPDQCRAVYLASHLWWAIDSSEEGQENKELYRDGKRVLECLQRALRVADACMDTAVSVELFVEILNRYVYYFDQQNETVTTKYLNGLIELIHSNLSTANTEQNSQQQNQSLENPKRHFYRTLEYIRSREFEGIVTEARS